MTDRPKRPRDANQLAKFIVDKATDEEVEGKKPRSLGSKGGKARAESLPAKRRQEIARAAAEARWGKRPAPSEEE